MTDETTIPIPAVDAWAEGVKFAAKLASGRAKAYRDSIGLANRALEGSGSDLDKKWTEAANALELLARDLGVYGRELK